MEEDNITAFISYSWDSDEHVKWVNRLAHIIYNNKIDTFLDQICVSPGNNLDRFMMNGISKSRWIICIISEGYIQKMNQLTTGVGKEIELIKKSVESDYVIPILRHNTNKILPEIFTGKFWLDFDNNGYEENIKKLIKKLYGFEKLVAPISTKKPYEREIANEVLINAEIAKTTFIDPSLSGRVSFNYSDNDGIFTIGSGEFEFRTKWSKASNISIHAYKDELGNGKIAVINNLSDFSEFVSSNELNFTSRTRTPKLNDAIVWINTYGNMAITKITQIHDYTRGDEDDLLVFEYQILEEQR